MEVRLHQHVLREESTALYERYHVSANGGIPSGPVIQRSNHKHHKSAAITEIREYEGFAHLLPAQPGGERIAD